MAIAGFSNRGSLDSIKSKDVGDGQHGTARWATPGEIKRTFRSVPFQTALWRKGERLPGTQGLVLGCTGKKGQLTALVDSDDIHCLMMRRLRRWQDRLLPIPQFGIRLRQRNELLCQ